MLCLKMSTKQTRIMVDEHVYCARGGRETGRPGYVGWPAEIWGIFVILQQKTSTKLKQSLVYFAFWTHLNA